MRIKHLLFLVLPLLFCSQNTIGQILKNINVDLNSGGAIYDVVYDVTRDAYVIVGEFSSVNSVPRNNLALLDANTFALLPENPITSINGAIRSVEITQKYVAPGDVRSYIYIGGDFNLVNTYSHVYLARLRSLTSPFPPYNFTNYSIQAWDAELINLGSQMSYGVNDLHLSSDTLIAVGEFVVWTPSHGLGVDQFNIICFDADEAGLNLINLFIPAPTQGGNFIHFNGIKRFNDQFYLYGKHGIDIGYIKRFDLNGTLDVVNYVLNGIEADVWDLEITTTPTDTILFLSQFYGAGSEIYSHGIDGGIFTQGYPPQDISQYKNDTYFSNLLLGQLLTYNRPGGYAVNLINTINLNSYWTSISQPLDQMAYNRTNIAQNMLFLSGENLTTVDGQPRVGLAIFCLEPSDAKDFTAFDLSICAGNQQDFTIPTADYADGYRWSYTGTGATFRKSGSALPYQPLTSGIINANDGNSIDVLFVAGASGGTLTVEPYSVCNVGVDTLFATGKSIVLTSAPLPNISVMDTLAFTCSVDTLDLVIQSATPGVSYEWNYVSFPIVTPIFNDSILINITNNPTDSLYYFATVTEPINGCQITDSVFVLFDTIPPSINVAGITSTPPVFNCATTSMVVNSNISGSSVSWSTISNPTNLFADGFSLFSDDSINFRVYATSLTNGCTAQQDYNINVDVTNADGMLIGYPSLASLTIVDSVNCGSPTLDLTCDVTAPFSAIANAEWLNGNTPTGLTLLSLSEADTTGMDPTFKTKIYRFITTHSTTFCTDTINVVIKFDFEVPFVVNHTGSESINCSENSVNVIHALTGGPVVEGWLNALNIQTGINLLNATTTGDYFYEVTSTINGCTSADTVTIAQTFDMFVELPTDTIICPEEIITLTAVPINNIEIPSYLWSTSETTPSINAEGAVDSIISVIVQTPSGCIAYDTISVLITSPIAADFLPLSSCLGGSIQVSNVNGGSGNYQYSLDGTNWQTTTSFSGLSFGTYTISIQDDLNCIYTFNETIDQYSSGIDVNFLASTYNESGDTLAIVNISDFTGFDSLAWTAPVEANIYSENDSLIILSIGTNGWYDVTLTGYVDTCIYSFTKEVYFGDEKPIFDIGYDTLGIQSLSIYPNPTSGNFSVNLTFGVVQNYTILVTNLQGQPMAGMNTTGMDDGGIYTFTFPIGSPSGAYLVHIIADYDADQSTIILN